MCIIFAMIKTLGIIWHPQPDVFKFEIGPFQHQLVTKRNILSKTAQIFDPLGLIGPITVVAKIILQRLWQYKLSWDETIPYEIKCKWLQFHDQLTELNNLKISRNTLIEHYVSAELHGFCDASEDAYGACIYLRTINQSDDIKCSLLCAKSRVAPLRNVTLPRLELCAAVLLVHLTQKVLEGSKIKFKRYFFWSDSTIAFSWIKGEACRWKTFVANRVSEIQGITSTKDWFHVSTQDNLADLLSRGTTASHLCTSDLWWHGPFWLSQTSTSWPDSRSKIIEDLPKTKFKNVISLPAQITPIDILQKYSSIVKLQRVIAYILRFAHNSTPGCERKTNHLTVVELNCALNIIIKIAQNEAYHNEIQSVITKIPISKKSKLLGRNPFLDANGILRVGGRLQNANLRYDNQHPIILSPKHIVARLIAEHKHRQLLHCGAQSLLASLLETYWIPNGRNLAKAIVHRCVLCFRSRPRDTHFLMGSLPTTRVTQSFAFENTGVDYAGPITIRDKKSRGFKLLKAYIALFVCFSTKAIHLEVVTDLTTENFVAALRRFIARRGKPRNLYSDNATNFSGASSQLAELSAFLRQEKHANKILDVLGDHDISWHFIPPRSPHFGGLWEAGVKAVKIHLLRVAGNAHLTYEELSTLLTQIEAILNSRPLCPLSTDPTDLNPLTPGHFLIGRPLTSAPDPTVLHIPENRLSTYQRIQSLTQHFWRRWSREYLPQLQTRSKWKTSSQTLLQPGAMVLIKEDNLPPLRWQLGRIDQLHPGPDNVVRVITVRVKNGLLKRAVSKVCVLPVGQDNLDT